MVVRKLINNYNVMGTSIEEKYQITYMTDEEIMLYMIELNKDK